MAFYHIEFKVCLHYLICQSFFFFFNLPFSDTPQGHHTMAFSQNNNGGILNSIYGDGTENSKLTIVA